MLRKVAITAGLMVSVNLLGGCFSLTDFDGNMRQINHYGKELHDWRVMANKYFMDYDSESPFED